MLSKRVALLVVTLALGNPVAARADQAAADAAFGAGELAKALTLYEEVLRAQPRNTHVLFRVAQLRTWRNERDIAEKRVDALLKIQPANTWGLGLKADLLVARKKYAEALAVWDELGKKNPDDRGVIQGRARVAVSRRDFEAALSEYDRLLAKDSHDLDAMIQKARIYTWAGSLDVARRFYLDALAVAPSHKPAEVGLAYLDLWSGAGAGRAVSDLQARYPKDKEIDGLHRAWLRSRALNVTLGYSHQEDNVGTELQSEQVELRIGLGVQASVRFEAARYEYSNNAFASGLSGSEHVGAATLTVETGGGRLFSLRAGLDSREATTGTTDTGFVGGAKWDWGRGRRVQGSIGANRDFVRYSTFILDLGVVNTTYGGQIVAALDPHFSLEGSLQGTRQSDDRSQSADGINVSTGVKWRGLVGRVLPLQVGYGFGYQDFNRDLANGSFMPRNFWTHRVQVGTNYPLGKSGGSLTVGLDGVLQNGDTGAPPFERAIENEIAISGLAVLTLPIGKPLRVDLIAARHEGGIAADSGIVVKSYSARLRWVGR